MDILFLEGLLRDNLVKELKKEIERDPAIVFTIFTQGWNMLMKSISFYAFECMVLLVKEGADMNVKNEFGQTALMIAAYLEHVKIVEFLLEQGATISLRENKGRSAFQIALSRDLKSSFELFRLYKNLFDEQDLELYYQMRLPTLLA